ncbi:phosphatase 1 regulatory subunit 12C [Salmo salar]|uniref:Protein phosphatase 1 regulatory subunit n=1 Tax=Salmo salar TaxID=8030 RepID=B5X1M8_SALSA|nr:phosphatase 1 regulatory subunit 12C [Salmo salar]ACI33209.1 phosphatase 1 regulatory subunit 12C [Salmo salar]|eukprot:NP_001133423.1 phosphatase 1 regulatory subunit 12C [Salmo salar]
MGDTAKDKRQEQLKRWSGSSTDREPAVPRRRWRGDVEDAGCSEAVNNAVSNDRSQDVGGSGSTTGEANSLLLKRRRRVRFDTAAEFLAACASGDTDEAQEMLKDAKETEGKNGDYRGEVVNCANADGITALHQACIDGSMEVMVFLLAQGANINQVDSEGWTPLHVAATCGNLEITDFLLQQGASLTAVNCDGDVPLDIAEDEATESLLHQYTVRQGVDVEAAKRVEEEQIMKDARAWLTEGPPSELRHPKTGATPLHVAAAKGYLEAIKLLCQCGLDVSEMDCDGWTPLHAASHWGQGDACKILAEQLCDMEVCSNGGQTPFDVADESVVSLLEELSQKQANWRNEQSIMDRQNPAGSTAAKADNKRRRTSVCRMSSKEKMNVPDQSKERRSEGLELSEEKESSPESSTLSSPDTESATSTVNPAEKQIPEEKDVEERDQDRASRTARVQPTPQRKDPVADSPNNTNPDRRKFQAPVRDEESESQRKARSRLMRQSRRSTQGVTLTDLKEAEKSVAKPADPPPSNILHVSPTVTITPAERDTDPVKEVGSEGETRLGVRDRRKGRRERRSTGVVQLGNEHLDAMDEAQQDENHHHSSPSEPQLGDSSPDYKMLYRSVLQENGLLKDKLEETALLLSQSKVELERLRQSQESNTERPALLELERFEKRALQRKAVELEDELKVLVDLRADNQRLKDENAALIRVISKLSK